MGRENNKLGTTGAIPSLTGSAIGHEVNSKRNEEPKDDFELKQDIPLKQNLAAGLETLGPKFWTHDSQFATPIATAKNYLKVKGQLHQIKQIARKRYDVKQKRLNDASKTWPSYFKLLGTRRTIPSMRKEVGSLNDLKAAAEACDAPLAAYEDAAKRLRTLRQRPIPRDETKRNQFFDQLKQAATAVKSAGKKLDEALSNLSDQVDKRKKRIRWSRSWLRAPFRNTSRYKHVDDIRSRLDYVTRHMLQTRDLFKDNIAQQMDAEIARIGELKSRIVDAADGKSGQDALDNVLGKANEGVRLRASVALEALRCGEPLSPRLKHALDDQVVVPDTWEPFGQGNNSKVYKAKLRLPGPDSTEIEYDYVLKPLDARIPIDPKAPDIGLARQQVGVFARHCAANEISEAMGMDFVGKPQLIEKKGRLFLALPLVKGFEPWQLEQDLTISHALGIDLSRYNRVAKALHDNTNFQNVCKEVQLLQVFLNDPDSHYANIKFRFINPETGKDVSPQQMAELSADKISALEVKAGLFDLDWAFAPMGSIHQEYKDPVREKFPKRWRYIGPPPYHTNVDRERTEKLLTNLETGPLSRDMRWHLINDGSPDHDEFVALKKRTAALKKHMDEDTLHRLDANTGQLLNSLTSEPYGDTDWRRYMSDHAPEVLHGLPGGADYVLTTPASNTHKYMELKNT